MIVLLIDANTHQTKFADSIYKLMPLHTVSAITRNWHTLNFLLPIILQMNWIYGICSCITPNFYLKETMINVLNSHALNSQIFEEEKCTEQTNGSHLQPNQHIYALAKTKSYNFMKMQQKSDDEDEQHQTNKAKADIRKNIENEQQNDEVIDAFWYPKAKKGVTRMQHYRRIFDHKDKTLAIILQQDPSSKHYDKVYDSQDQIKLVVYCKLESLVRGKRMNSYKFSFDVAGLTLSQYEEWFKQADDKQILPLLQATTELEKDPEDPSFLIVHRKFKKLLIVNPHDLVTAQKTTNFNEQEGKSVRTTIFSVQETESNEDQSEKKHHRGWLHLAGLEVLEIPTGLHVKGYLCIELDVSVSPNMLKQPFSKQIRVFAQKLICSLKKSDEI